MTVSLRPVTRDDLSELFKIKVTAKQSRYVAPNEFTLAQAPYETGSYVFVIRANDVRVGLIALIDMTEHDDVKPEDDAESGYIWRLLIGEQFQGQGFGSAAINLACDWARDRGRPRMSIQAVIDNAEALGLYERLGFEPTGVIVEGEAQLIRQL